MSRVGKLPIPIPDKVKVDIKGSDVTITGPKGSLSRSINPDLSMEVEDNHLVVKRPDDTKYNRAQHGLYRSLLNNMILGVSEGYKKELQMIGVGYKGEMKGKVLSLALGYSHPIILSVPEEINIEVVPKENRIIITGIDKELVGQVASKIRGYRKPEPYKGKGVRYVGEYVRSKAGKTAG